MITAKICPWLVNVSGWPTVAIPPHTFLISRMLTDYVIEHFLLKIAFETAKMFPALAKKCFGEKSLRLQAFFLENANGGQGVGRRRVVREKGVLVKVWGGAQLISLKLSS